MISAYINTTHSGSARSPLTPWQFFRVKNDITKVFSGSRDNNWMGETVSKSDVWSMDVFWSNLFGFVQWKYMLRITECKGSSRIFCLGSKTGGAGNITNINV